MSVVLQRKPSKMARLNRSSGDHVYAPRETLLLVAISQHLRPSSSDSIENKGQKVCS